MKHKATQNAKQSLEYGTNIVGGVTPGRDGEHLSLPLLPSVRAVSEILDFSLPRGRKRYSDRNSGERTAKAGCDSNLRGCPIRRWSH